LKKLKPQTGFYHQPEELEGFHVLLNYRSNKTPQKIAELVTLTEILTDRAKPDVVKDKIVLIGVTDPIVKDYFKTSYNQELRGLMLHAQMVSQLVSAVKEQRHLLSFFPLWVDALWVCTWSLLGGLLIWNFQSLLHRGIAVGALVIVLCGTSFLFLLEEGVLVPLVPSALALLTSGGWIVVYTAFKPNDHSNNL
jgi:CHASE2 domain-containing sensor protein